MPMRRQDDLVRAYVDHEEEFAVSFSAVDEKQARPSVDSMGKVSSEGAIAFKAMFGVPLLKVWYRRFYPQASLTEQKS